MRKLKEGLSISSTKKSTLNKRETTHQFIKFSLIGFLNTAVHYGVFVFLYRYMSIYYLAASVTGYIAGLINSFIFNKKWTFKTRGMRTDIEFMKFVVVNFVALLANVGSMGFLVSYMNIMPELAQLISVMFTVMINFWGNKFWTFRLKVELPS